MQGCPAQRPSPESPGSKGARILQSLAFDLSLSNTLLKNWEHLGDSYPLQPPLSLLGPQSLASGKDVSWASILPQYNIVHQVESLIYLMQVKHLEDLFFLNVPVFSSLVTPSNSLECTNRIITSGPFIPSLTILIQSATLLLPQDTLGLLGRKSCFQKGENHICIFFKILSPLTQC